METWQIFLIGFVVGLGVGVAATLAVGIYAFSTWGGRRDDAA